MERIDHIRGGYWVHEDNAMAEIRRLRAMVLRAHAERLGEWPSCKETGVESGAFRRGYTFAVLWAKRVPGATRFNSIEVRAARLLNHFASAIEAGRL
jgi:hypothetical protein